MKKFDTVKKNLLELGYKVSVFATAKDAADYLDSSIDGVTVGFGGSMTLQGMGMFDRLKAHNTVYSHLNGFPVGDGFGPPTPPDSSVPGFKEVSFAKVFLTSANGLAETGEIINIDGYGNRVSAMLFGHEKIYFVVGRNKIAPTYDEAMWRARNIAAPKNAQRKNLNTPCAAKADKCYNCKSPDRICRGVAILWAPVHNIDTEVVLIDEDLGF